VHLAKQHGWQDASLHVNGPATEPLTAQDNADDALHSSFSFLSLPPWPALDEAAYWGLAGEIVRTIEPHTESDPVALLVQFLIMVGNAIGHAP
jgi:hypothetical protein